MTLATLKPLADLDLSRVRAVTFDFGGTLLTPFPSVGAVYAEVLARREVTVSAEIVEARFRQAFVELRSKTHSGITEATELAYWRAIVHRALSPECPAALLDSVFTELWEEFSHARRWQVLPGASALLKAFAAVTPARSLAVFSNWDSRLHRVLDELGWSSQFQHLFISSEIGFEKPHPSAFRAVESALKLPPEAILHIGDSYAHDYQPASAAGWQALLVSPFAPASDFSALRVARLDDLLPLLS
jgi:putative hydrolase of the HAD superfamily